MSAFLVSRSQLTIAGIRYLLKFTLVYEGQLKPASKAKATDKHKIRQVFDQQLQELWKQGQMVEQRSISMGSPNDPDSVLKTVREVDGCHYLPVVSEAQGLLADVSITWLRYQPPGSVLQAGDIDNRLKTLLDCLQTPPVGQAVAVCENTPADNPFCTALDDDALISSLSVKTVQDLRPSAKRGEVLLVIQIEPIVIKRFPFGNYVF